MKGTSMKSSLLIALAGTALFSVSAIASEQSDVIATVHQFLDGMNKGYMKSGLAACADETSIIDTLAPHEWHGKGACETWANAVGAEAQKVGMTDVVFTVKKPTILDVAGDSAYAVMPAGYTYKMKGKAGHVTGGVFTVALKKEASGWRLTGWTYSGR